MIQIKWSRWDDPDLMTIQIKWWSSCDDDPDSMMIQIKWSRCDDDPNLMTIQIKWWSSCDDDPNSMMIQMWWWSRLDDDPDEMMIQQWWASSHDDADPMMNKTWRIRWLEDSKTKKTWRRIWLEDSKRKKTWRLRRLEDEDDEMIQLMQRRRPVLKIVSKEYLPFRYNSRFDSIPMPMHIFIQMIWRLCFTFCPAFSASYYSYLFIYLQ